MFKKAAVFTDLHCGMKGNSKVHNQDCEDFVDWYIETAQKNGCDTGICLYHPCHRGESSGIRLLRCVKNIHFET